MKVNLWQQLEMRLQAKAKGHYKDAQRYDSPNQSALLVINLLKDKSGNLLGWHRPLTVILEPKDFDPFLVIKCERVSDWSIIMAELHHKTEATLVIRRGKPIAWLDK
jgi:hypothetical protein